MTICGLKLTHDSSIALIEDGKLLFSIELEKINNNNRFKILEDLSQIPDILKDQGVLVKDINHFVIDGWVGLKEKELLLTNYNKELIVKVAPYHEDCLTDNLLTTYSYPTIALGNDTVPYFSYMHVTNHLSGVYCMSPFSKNQESAYVLIWDGGMYPRLYHIDPKSKSITNLGPLFYMAVNIYSIFVQHYGPFKINENVIKDELSIAGKVMAYVAHGNVKEAILQDLEHTYQETIKKAQIQENIAVYPYHFTLFFRNLSKTKYYYDEDVITSFHAFLEKKLVSSLIQKIRSIEKSSSYPNLCIGGGAALNIKWNSSIRQSGLLRKVWVSPVPNDSGSALGAACSHMLAKTDTCCLDWNIFTGPRLKSSQPIDGWNSKRCDLKSLAKLLYEGQEPVIFFGEHAAIGPRSLGHRSILACPSQKQMKSILNNIKFRENYRPIAPICLEEKASLVFDPGTPDPYMLFDHKIKDFWKDKIPAISHLDNTARVQTISATTCPKLHELLTHFDNLSGLPVLCNTSANFKGSGFFPDLFSASRWGKVNYIWHGNFLYEKIDKVKYF